MACIDQRENRAVDSADAIVGYAQGTGISSHYEAAASLASAAVYRINLDDWQEQTRGAVAVTAVHEAIPGHHLQPIFRRSVRGQSLMIDPAIHEKRWNRQRAKAYLQALGES